VSDVYRASLRGGWDAALRRVVGIDGRSGGGGILHGAGWRERDVIVHYG
jgi:hypothetical protein